MSARGQTRFIPKKARDAMTSIEQVREGSTGAAVFDGDVAGTSSSEFEQHGDRDLGCPGARDTVGRGSEFGWRLTLLQDRRTIRTRQAREETLDLEGSDDIAFQNLGIRLRRVDGDP